MNLFEPESLAHSITFRHISHDDPRTKQITVHATNAHGMQDSQKIRSFFGAVAAVGAFGRRYIWTRGRPPTYAEIRRRGATLYGLFDIGGARAVSLGCPSTHI